MVKLPEKEAGGDKANGMQSAQFEHSSNFHRRMKRIPVIILSSVGKLNDTAICQLPNTKLITGKTISFKTAA
ncbi:hypothetical protein [Brucella gallinifaecis]|uniref:Uncharacterized protein n=1 Tax=Brucella gallinifaecis TaxID=215590 RepID=A0A502BPR1_9HYPH|nr:hypothetical protein [Brucella gallinifaecis]TPF76522.1 hypothetical protein FHY56_03215 [Brucella gallinifaecis]